MKAKIFWTVLSMIGVALIGAGEVVNEIGHEKQINDRIDEKLNERFGEPENEESSEENA